MSCTNSEEKAKQAKLREGDAQGTEGGTKHEGLNIAPMMRGIWAAVDQGKLIKQEEDKESGTTRAAYLVDGQVIIIEITPTSFTMKLRSK